MTAACKLCGQIIVGKDAINTVGDLIGSWAPASAGEVSDIGVSLGREAARQVANFDLLAGAVMQHISWHHSNEMVMMETVAVGNLSMKIFAMRHATSNSENFAQLRDSWSEGIRKVLFPVQATADAPDASPPFDASPSSSGAAS